MSEITATWRVGEVVDGRYEVTGVHEDGGMGVVHRVRHLAWDIDLAVKSPRSNLFQTAEDQRRFVAEAETWVSLGLHPHVCNCFYVRVLDGVPRVFAEYVPGGSLQDWIRDRRLYDGSPSEVLARVLDIAIQTAWGLDHAHSRGLVHRDVKPANVLLDDEDGPVTAKITDFGLARGRELAATINPDTPPGASIPVPGGSGMTPRYASPEQAAGEPVGRRTDIYSFAVSVLEMSIGEATWMAGPAAGAALAGYRTGAIVGAVELPPNLENLLRRCLHHDPADRPNSMAATAVELIDIYQDVTGSEYPRPAPSSADLLADDLNNRAVSLLDLDRHQEADQVFAQALAIDPQNARAMYNNGLARWRRGEVTDTDLVDEIESVRADTGDSWEVRFSLAQIHMERGDLTTSRRLLDRLIQERPDEPEALAALSSISSGALTDARCVGQWRVDWPAQPRSYNQDHVALAMSHDGRLLLSGGGDHKVRLWDVHSGRCMRAMDGHDREIQAVDLTPDGRSAVSVDKDQAVWFWKLPQRGANSAQRQCLRSGLEPVPGYSQSSMSIHLSLRGDTAVRLTPDGRFALHTGVDGVFRVWDTRSGQLRVFDATAAEQLVAISADGRRALSLGWRGGKENRERVVRLWDLADRRCLRELNMGYEYEEVLYNSDRLPNHDSQVAALGLSKDGRIAAIGHFGRIKVWDLEDGRCLHVLKGRTTARSLSFSADARFLLAGGSGGERPGNLQFWDLDHGQCLRTFPAHRDGTTVVHLDAIAQSGLSVGQDGMVRRWELPGEGNGSALRLSRPRRLIELNRLADRVDALVADAEQAIAADRFSEALQLLTQARAVEGYGRAPRVMSAWWALSRRTVRTGLRAAWSSRTWRTPGLPVAIDLSRDGRVAVSGDDGVGVIRLWDTESGTCLRVLEGHRTTIGSVCLSADSRMLLSSSLDGTVRLWEVDTGRSRRLLTDPRREWEHPSLPVRFSADERHAVVGGRDERLQFWDMETGELVRELPRAFGRGIHDLSLSDDGRLAMVGGMDGVELWDLAADRLVGRRSSHPLLPKGGVSLSADTRHALSSEDDGSGDDDIVLWDTATGTILRTFERPPDNAEIDGLRMTADGRFAVSGGGSPAVWDVHGGRRLRVLGRNGTFGIAITSDCRFVLAANRDQSLQLWELDWELAAREAADWDEGAAPYLEAFLRRHGPRWSDRDFEALSSRLQDVGYGWLRADGVRARLDGMAADQDGSGGSR